MSKCTFLTKGRILIEDAKFAFRKTNFSGEEIRDPKTNKIINTEGKRNFSVVIEDPDFAQELAELGWNVKLKKQYNPDDPIIHYIDVEVSFRPVRNTPDLEVRMITDKAQVFLSEDTIEILDHSEISTLDVIIRPYTYTKDNGEDAVKAYLHKMVVVIETDVLDKKWGSMEYPEE